MHRLHLLISGRVQGVGFRWYVLRAATALGLRGEVRNRDDGSVEVEAEGRREDLERLLEEAREGPAASVVIRVDERWDEGPARFRDFHVGQS